MKKILMTSILTLFISLCLIGVTGSQSHQQIYAFGDNLDEKIEIFRLILDTIQQRYVEERTVDELLEGAIQGMLSKLDPHTSYLPADNFNRWNKNFEGFEGIGIHYKIIDDVPVVTGFIEGSPAKHAGLEIADAILEINSRSLSDKSHREIAEIVDNTRADWLVLNVKKPDNSIVKYNIRRNHLAIKSIPVTTMLTKETGYIHIDRFAGNTAHELDYSLEKLLHQGMENLVLDMRDNGGGYLSSAVEVASRFLPPRKLIVFTKGKHEDSYQEYRSSYSKHYTQLPVIILINHGTASAAEIVAGALQDWDRALIVGKTSFGKGLVQSQYRFRDGSALLVTTARYYTPLGRLIQRNYYNRTKDEYYHDAYDEEARAMDENFEERKIFITGKGREVYGGGGITPDIISENKTSQMSVELLQVFLNHNSVFIQFAMQLYKENPDLQERKLKLFSRRYQLSRVEYNRFKNILSEKVFLKDGFFTENEHEIVFLLKREIAYLVHGELGRLWVSKDRDDQLMAALQHVDKAKPLILNGEVSQVSKIKTD